MNDFTINVIKIINHIPRGFVMTYGSIAECAGNPRASRQVSRILHSMSKAHGLPWHRVIRKDGGISLPEDQGGEIQRLMLEAEGVAFDLSGRVDLKRFFWQEAFDLDFQKATQKRFKDGE